MFGVLKHSPKSIIRYLFGHYLLIALFFADKNEKK
jgi:hypothetical protein